MGNTQVSCLLKHLSFCHCQIQRIPVGKLNSNSLQWILCVSSKAIAVIIDGMIEWVINGFFIQNKEVF